jgi:hypothetical protein
LLDFVGFAEGGPRDRQMGCEIDRHIYRLSISQSLGLPGEFAARLSEAKPGGGSADFTAVPGFRHSASKTR